MTPYLRRIKLQSASAMTYNHRGLAYRAIGQLARSIQDFTEAARRDGQLAAAYYNRSVSQWELENYVALY